MPAVGAAGGAAGGAAAGVAAGPLAGLRVLELGAPGPTPWAAMVLAGMGAAVLRVDRPDAARRPFPGQSVLTRDRTRVALDLKDAGDRQRLLTLASYADVLLEGNRPGVAERLGVGPADCAARNPRLVYGRMTGWGQEGPLAGMAGHDLNYLAATGALTATVGPGALPPYPLAAALTFGGGAAFLVIGVLAALRERDSSGRGQVVDASVADGLSLLLASAYGLLAEQGDPNPSYGAMPHYGTYPCADGLLLAIAPFERSSWANFTAVTGLGGPDGDLRSAIAERLASRTRADWLERFDGVDAGVSPVLDLAEVPGAPHMTARGGFVPVGGEPQPAPAPRFSRTANPLPAWAAAPGGAWTPEVLRAAGIARSAAGGPGSAPPDAETAGIRVDQEATA